MPAKGDSDLWGRAERNSKKKSNRALWRQSLDGSIQQQCWCLALTDRLHADGYIFGESCTEVFYEEDITSGPFAEVLCSQNGLSFASLRGTCRRCVPDALLIVNHRLEVVFKGRTNLGAEILQRRIRSEQTLTPNG